MKNEILIVPDVHGRRFWRKAVMREWAHIVFLGDYLDPYPEEEITFEQAVSEFMDILALKYSNPQGVTLLLGNHDAHYWWNTGLPCCRYSEEYSRLIHYLLRQREEYFQLVFTRTINNKKYVFSHAGILPSWLKDNKIQDIEPENLNKLLKFPSPDILQQVTIFRGGWDDFGSPIWADIREWLEETPQDGVYNIFGHSQIMKPAIAEHFACLDCRICFCLNIETGELRAVDASGWNGPTIV